MPVAAAKIVAVTSTARYSEPRTDANASWMPRNSRSMRPDCSSRKPMNRKNGTDASVGSRITEKTCSVIRCSASGPSIA